MLKTSTHWGQRPALKSLRTIKWSKRDFYLELRIYNINGTLLSSNPYKTAPADTMKQVSMGNSSTWTLRRKSSYQVCKNIIIKL